MTPAPRIAAIVLAAGLSRRMEGQNKLIATIDGVPLVRRAVLAAAASPVQAIYVVTGHRRRETEAALAGLAVTFVPNPRYADGLSTSLRAGLAALPPDIEGALVLLGDMPAVAEGDIARLVAAFGPGRIVVSTDAGQPRNPVLWSQAWFAELAHVEGDRGGKGLIDANPDAVVGVEIGPAASLDIDDPAALAALGGRFAE